MSKLDGGDMVGALEAGKPRLPTFLFGFALVASFICWETAPPGAVETAKFLCRLWLGAILGSDGLMWRSCWQFSIEFLCWDFKMTCSYFESFPELFSTLQWTQVIDQPANPLGACQECLGLTHQSSTVEQKDAIGLTDKQICLVNHRGQMVSALSYIHAQYVIHREAWFQYAENNGPCGVRKHAASCHRSNMCSKHFGAEDIKGDNFLMDRFALTDPHCTSACDP